MRFGRKAKPLPANFHEIVSQWAEKKLSATQAAKACEMPTTSFLYRAENIRDILAGWRPNPCKGCNKFYLSEYTGYQEDRLFFVVAALNIAVFLQAVPSKFPSW